MSHFFLLPRLCDTCTVCPGGSHFEVKACTKTSDAECSECETCASGFFLSQACTTTSNAVCKPCEECTAGSTFAAYPCLLHQNRHCLPCTQCSENQFVSKVCTVDYDTQCLNITQCDIDEFESSPPRWFSDRECTKHTECTSTQFETLPPTLSTDRKCDSISDCSSQEYISKQATYSSDVVCSTLRQCTSSQYESIAPTPTSNRFCNALTVCQPFEEFEMVPPGLARDRVCAPLSTCSKLEYEATQPTATTDRQCKDQVLPGLAPLTSFSAWDGLYLIDNTAYTTSESQQNIILLQDLSTASGSLSSKLAASVGNTVATASIDPLLPNPSYVRFEVAGSGIIFEDTPWVRGAIQISAIGFIPRRTEIRVTGSLLSGEFSNSTSTSCKTNYHGLCTIALRIPDIWFVETTNPSVKLSLQADDDEIDLDNVVFHVSQPTIKLEKTVLFVPERDVYVRLPTHDVEAGEKMELDVVVESEHPVSSFAAVVTTSNSRLVLEHLNPDYSLYRAATTTPSMSSGAISAIQTNTLQLRPSGKQTLFTITARVPVTASSGTVQIDVEIHALDNSKGESIAPGGRELPARVVFVDRRGASASRAGEITITKSSTRSIFAVPSSSRLLDTSSLARKSLSFDVFLYRMGNSGGFEELPSSEVICTSSDSETVLVKDDCNLLLDDTTTGTSATISIIHKANLSLTTSFVVQVMKPYLPLAISVEDTELNLVAGWKDPSNRCMLKYQISRVRVFATFSDGENTISGVDVTELVPLSVSNDGVATVSRHYTSSGHFKGAYISGFQPGSITLSTSIDDHASGTTVTVTSTPVVVTRLDVTPIVSIGFSPGLLLPLAPEDSYLASVSTSSTFTSVGQQGDVHASVVFSDSSRMEISSADGLQLVSSDSNVVKVQGTTLDLLSLEQIDNPPSITASWRVGACSSDPIIETKIDVSMALPSTTKLTVSPDDRILAAPTSVAAMDPFNVPTSTHVSVIATLTDGTRLDLSSSTSVDLLGPDKLVLKLTSTGISVSVKDGTPTGYYDVTVSHSSVQSVFTITVVDVEDIEAECRFHSNGHTSQTLEDTGVSNAMLVSTLAPFAAVSPITFRRCEIHVRGILTASGNSGSSEFTQNVASSAIFDVTPAAAITIDNSIVSVSNPDQPVLGDVIVSIDVDGIQTNLELKVTTESIAATAASLLFPAQLRGIALETSAVPKAQVMFSDGTRFDDVSSLPQGIVHYTLEEPMLSSGTGRSAILENNQTGYVVLHGNSVAYLTLGLVSDEGKTLAHANFACNLLPRVGELDFGLDNGIPLRNVVAGQQLSIELRANAGTHVLHDIKFDVAFNSSLVSYKSAFAGVTYSAQSNGFTADILPNTSATTGRLRMTLQPTEDVAEVIHIATLTFDVMPHASGKRINFAGFVLEFNGLDGATVAQSASVDNPIGSPAAYISAVVDFPVTTDAKSRRDVDEIVECPTPPCVVCATGRPHELGDVNADCIFNHDDIIFFLDTFQTRLLNPSHFETLLTIQRIRMDANNDGVVDMLDLDLLNRVLEKNVVFLHGVMIQPVDTASGCRLQISVQASSAGDVFALPNNTHIFFDIESDSIGFDQFFEGSVVEVGELIPVDKGSDSLQGGLWKAAHLGNGRFGVVVQTPLESEELHGLTMFQVTTFGESESGSSVDTVNLDALSFTWFGLRTSPFAFAPFNFELEVAGMPSVSFASTLGYNPHMEFTNEEATPSCHFSTECAADEYQTSPSTATTSVQCHSIKVCQTEEFETLPPTKTTDRQCSHRIQCNFHFEYEISPGDATTDRSCANITICEPDEAELRAPTPNADRICRFNGTCSRSMYESVPLTVSTDRVCLPLTECGTGYSVLVEPTPTSDRECTVKQFCSDGLCLNNGTCINLPHEETYHCDCRPGFTGGNCESIDACELYGSNPCGSGTCVSFDGGIRCTCSGHAACSCCTGISFLPCSNQGLGSTGDFCVTPNQVADAIASRDEDNREALTSETIGVIVGGVLAGFLLITVVLFVVSSIRRRRDEDFASFEKDPFAGTLTSLNNPLFAPTSQYLGAFKRVVCFSFLRYNDSLVLQQNPEELGIVYDILLIPRPPKRLLESLRDDYNSSMLQKATSIQSKRIDEAVDFLYLAIADVILEEYIDNYSISRSGDPVPYHVSVLNDSDGLIPKRWAAYLDPVTGQVEEPLYEELAIFQGDGQYDHLYVSDGQVTPMTYSQAERFLARTLSRRKVPSYDFDQNSDNHLYSRFGTEVGRATAHKSIHDGNLYDFGSESPIDVVYDFGTDNHQDERQDCLADLEDVNNEAVYDLAHSRPSVRVKDAVYDNNLNKDSRYDNRVPSPSGDYEIANDIMVSDNDENDYDNFSENNRVLLATETSNESASAKYCEGKISSVDSDEFYTGFGPEFSEDTALVQSQHEEPSVMETADQSLVNELFHTG